jgi:hypothetical protein
VAQGSVNLLMWRVNEIAALEYNLAKCPSSVNKEAVTERGMQFFTLHVHVILSNHFRVCELHFAGYIRGTWIANAFARLPLLQNSRCDFDSSGAGIALMLAKRDFSIKVFSDWATAYKSFAECSGITDIGDVMLDLTSLGYSATAEPFQICGTCYHLIFKPHFVLKSYFRQNRIRSDRRLCHARGPGGHDILLAALKATWTQDTTVFLQQVRYSMVIAPCPGSQLCSAPVPSQYYCAAFPQFDCCDRCFQQIVLPSSLYASFTPREQTVQLMGCDMAHPDIRSIFDAATTTEYISDFVQGVSTLLARTKMDTQAVAARNAQSNFAATPEAYISMCRSTPQQLAELQRLRDEVILLANKQLLATAEANNAYLNGTLRQSSGRVLAACQHAIYKRYCDGHGKRFDTESEARGSQRRAEARMMQNGALRML